jgi:predicted nicotinamide N-methyase
MSSFSFSFGLEGDKEKGKTWYSVFQESLIVNADGCKSMLADKPCQEVVCQSSSHEDIAFNQIKLNDMVFRIVQSKDIVIESGVVDVIPGVYEGGLKLWECTLDLVLYLANYSLSFQGLRILELGCGTGVVGIAAIKLFAPTSIVFADYNDDVLSETTWPNIMLNITEDNSQCDMHCYSGDWLRLISFIKTRSVNFDIILSAEVLYTEENCKKIAFFLDQMLPFNGQAILANKRYYFGTGGGSTLFESYVNEIGTLTVSTVSSIEDGQSNIRDIQVVTRKQI